MCGILSITIGSLEKEGQACLKGHCSKSITEIWLKSLQSLWNTNTSQGTDLAFQSWTGFVWPWPKTCAGSQGSSASGKLLPWHFNGQGNPSDLGTDGDSIYQGLVNVNKFHFPFQKSLENFERFYLADVDIFFSLYILGGCDSLVMSMTRN